MKQLSRRTFLLSLSAGACVALLGACGQPTASTSTPAAPAQKPSQATQSSTQAGAKSAAASPATQAPAASAAAKPEKPNLKVGLSVPATSELPIYLGADRTYAEEGLNVQLVTFRGGAEMDQALAGDSIDINVDSLNTLLNMITANVPVKGFYAGFYQADFEWIAKPEIKKWGDLKGKSLGISTYGSLTDFLSRYALQKNGLDPEKDVHIVQAGGSPQASQALEAGKLDSAILSPPFKWQLSSKGFTVLGTQTKDVSPAWPKHVLTAKEKLISDNPNTIRAFLRAHVKAIRLAKSDRSAAVASMVKNLKYSEQDADRAYDDVMGGFNERGELPTQSMPVFWEIAKATGDAKEPWPESKFMDRKFIDTFDQWAPK